MPLFSCLLIDRRFDRLSMVFFSSGLPREAAILFVSNRPIIIENTSDTSISLVRYNKLKTLDLFKFGCQTNR